MPSYRWFPAALLFVCSSFGLSQSDVPSLGDVARQNREAHKTAEPSPQKKVLDNEDLASNRGPIPEISLTRTDNYQQIVDAIQEYAKKHGDRETETAMHGWYNQEIGLLLAATKKSVALNQDRMAGGSANSLDQPHGYDDYRKYQESRMGMEERDINDLKTLADYSQVISRISTTLREVKTGVLAQHHWQLEWFDTDYPRDRFIYMSTRPASY